MGNRMKRTGSVEKKQVRVNTGRLLTLREAGEYLGLTTWAMRERVWNGQIPFVRFDGGRKLYIDRHDIDSFVERHKATFK